MAQGRRYSSGLRKDPDVVVLVPVVLVPVPVLVQQLH